MSVLQLEGLNLNHGQLRAVIDFDLSIEEGQTVAVIGANGAGKSTLLAGVAGLLPVASGSIRLDGADVTTMPAYRRVGAGVGLVPEGRRLFRSLTVEENLETGAYRARPGYWNLERVYELFDFLRERRGQSAWQLSGGEQQAVAIGRALMGNPRVLLVDELSLGLSPAIVKRIYATMPRIVEQGTSVFIVEQDVAQAARAADYLCCLLEGRTVLRGTPAQLGKDEIERAYFGVAANGAH